MKIGLNFEKRNYQVSGLIAGVMFGLLSGQPLTMLGLTGPDLVFESLVITFLSCRVLMLKITKWSSTVRRKPFFFQAKKEALSAIFLPSKKGSFINHFSSKEKRKLCQAGTSGLSVLLGLWLGIPVLSHLDWTLACCHAHHTRRHGCQVNIFWLIFG